MSIRDCRTGSPATPPRHLLSIGDENDNCPDPVRIAYRSFDRQWIIPDKRLINQPNPTLWRIASNQQAFLTTLTRTAPISGPAKFWSEIPDLDHYKGSFGGRVYPLWLDGAATESNVVAGLLAHLNKRLGRSVSPEDLFAYIGGILSHPGYIASFKESLKTPGLRVPLTANAALFEKVSEIGRTVLWLHSYGERFVDARSGRTKGRPRLSMNAPKLMIPISTTPEEMPDTFPFPYDEEQRQLTIGTGRIDNVTPEMVAYEVSGVNVLGKWFSYRRKHCERPNMGDRRVSPLSQLHAQTWRAEYTKELLDLLNVVGMLVELEPRQLSLLADVAQGDLITVSDLI